MLKNYIITALRNFRHQKVFTLINILGLSVGISAALVIYLIVRYDFSFERSQKDGDRIYRVVSDLKFSGEPYHNSGVTDPLPDAASKEMTGLEASAAIYVYDPKVTIPSATGTKPAVFKSQQKITFADENYFKLFSFYTWLAGSPQSALATPFQVVLTEERAKVYFPGSDPSRAIGRTILYDDSITATVAGILKEPDVITDFNFQEFISRSTIRNSGLKKNMADPDWNSINGNSQYLIKLLPGIRPAQVETQLATLRNKYAKEDPNGHQQTVQHLQPLYDIHFNADYGSFNEHMGHKPTLYGLILVAVFLLLLGCINFINLTTAQATQRAKEIGVRKTLGSSVRQLITQFLGETFLLTLISLLVSLLLAPWLLHIFSDFIPAGLHFDLWRHPGIFGFLVALLAVVTLFAGFYPAFVLSGFKPVQVLKNRAFTGSTNRRTLLRKTLTVSQFVIAQAFVIATLIVGQQIRYSLNADLGFKKEGIAYFYAPYTWGRPDIKRFVLLEKIRSIPGVDLASIASDPPSSGNTNSTGFKYTDGKKEVATQVQMKYGDSNYIPLYHLRLLAGRNVYPSDTMRELVINETYARLLGFTDPRKAVGAIIGDRRKYPVVGVISDFHHGSMRTAIKPLAIASASNNQFTIHIALQRPASGNSGWKTTLAQVEKAYKEIYPEEDFRSTFYDESIAKFYTAEENLARLLRWATGLTVFISCLGLLGLVIYSTNLRVKEIGVRKVLGASVTQIVSILSKDFVKLVAVAFLIAAPLAWWASGKWMANFAYRTTVPWWIFPASGGAMIVLALLTLSIRTIQAANANPVSSLRSE